MRCFNLKENWSFVCYNLRKKKYTINSRCSSQCDSKTSIISSHFCLKEWEDNFYVFNFSYTSHLDSATYWFINNLAFKPYSLEKYGIAFWVSNFHDSFPVLSYCSSVKVLHQISCDRLKNPRWILFLEAFPPLSRLISILDGMVAVTYVCLLRGQNCEWGCREKTKG